MKQNNFLFINSIFGIIFAALFGSFIFHLAGFSPVVGSISFVGAGALVGFSGVTTGNLATAFSITDIVAACGAFFRANKNIIIQDLYLELMNSEYVTEYDGVSDELPLPKITMQNIVKPADDVNFVPTANAIGVGARILKVRQWKVDLLINPNALVKTWLGFAKQKGTAQTKIPLEQYIVMHIVSKIADDIRREALFRGTYNASGTTPGAIMDGWLKLVADAITATTITPIVTGAITSSNVIDKLLLVHDGLDEAYKSSRTFMPVNPTIFDWAVRRYNPVTNASIVAGDIKSLMNDQGLLVRMPLAGTNTMLVREPGLGTSQRVMVSLKDNFGVGYDAASDVNQLRFQEFDRSIKVLGDGKIGVQFAQLDNKAIRVNDQA